MAAPDFRRGFFRVPRDVYAELLDNGDRDALLVYLELVSRAAFYDGRRVSGGGVVELKIGQCIVGRGDLAARTGTTEAKVRRSLALLEDRRLIAVEATKRGTTVTVLGLEEQPTNRQQNDQETANRSPENSQPNSQHGGDLSTGTRDGIASGGLENNQQNDQETANRSPTDRQPDDQQTATNREERRETRNGRGEALPRGSDHTYPAELLPLSEEIWAELAAMRDEVAKAKGETIRPWGVFEQGKVDLRKRLRESAGPDVDVERARADAKHVLAVRRAEAVFVTGTKWLSGSMFSEDSWRQALRASPQSYERRPAVRASAPGLRIVQQADDDMPPIRFKP